ncbi:MAG: hypothetical protein HXX14_01170 [Bacteroidetes bacterium]|nr:hypothetical protein [Bacteroidota bacterium]
MFNYYNIDSFNQESSSVVMDFIVTLFGTGAGFFCALFLSKKNERKQKVKENNDLINKYKSRLGYLTELISSSIILIETQVANLIKLAEEIKEKPTEVHLLIHTANNDLERLQKMDSEEVFHAYNLIAKEADDKSKNYHNIYSCIDYLYLRSKQGTEQVTKHVEYTYRDQMRIKELLDGLLIDLFHWKIFFQNKPKGHLSTQFHFFDLKSENFVNWETLGDLISEFVVPLEKELKENHLKEEYFPGLHNICVQAIFIYNHLVQNSVSFSKELVAIKSDIEPKIKILKTINTKLKSDISNYKNPILKDSIFGF